MPVPTSPPPPVPSAGGSSAASVLVVGAGLAGLTAAVRLAGAGVPVTVVDKGRGVGGRLATRRLAGARVDHGAQFFTVRSAVFATVVERWLAAGVAREWCRGFRSPPDGHPRYVGATGMTDLAKALAAGFEVRLSTRLDAIRPGAGGGWSAVLDGGGPLEAAGGGVLEVGAVICTPPVPQTQALLAGAGVEGRAAEALGAVRYDPTLAGLVVLDGAPALPGPGGVQLDHGPLSWVGDNQAKGISAVPALTLHARGDVSAEHYGRPDATVIGLLLAAGRPWMGTASPLDSQLARWRYANPTTLHAERCLVAVDGPRPIVCAGDAFGEAKVEGAVRSGLAAAAAVLERLEAAPARRHHTAGPGTVGAGSPGVADDRLAGVDQGAAVDPDA